MEHFDFKEMEYCLEESNRPAQENPFEDGSDYKSFVPSHYQDPEGYMTQASNLKNPCNLFKLMILKAAHFKIEDQNLKLKIKEIKKVQLKYQKVMQTNSTIMEEEKCFLKSANSTLDLAKLIIQLQLGEIDLKDVDLPKFRDICQDILNGYECGGSLIFFFHLIEYCESNFSECIEMARFLVLACMKVIRNVQGASGDKSGVILEQFGDLDGLILNLKLKILNTAFSIYEGIRKFISNPYNFVFDQFDLDAGLLLMKIFNDEDSYEDEFYKITLKCETLEQANDIFELTLKLNKERFHNSEGTFEDIYGSRSTKGIAYSIFAAFNEDPSKILKLCERSNKLLESSRHYYQKNGSKMASGILYRLDLNYSKMWRARLNIFRRTKKKSDSNKLTQTAEMRIIAGHVIMQEMAKSDDLDLIVLLMTNLDFIKCNLQVLRNVARAKTSAAVIYEILYNNPLHSVVMIFHQVTGIPLELLNNKEDFLRALIQKFYR